MKYAMVFIAALAAITVVFAAGIQIGEQPCSRFAASCGATYMDADGVLHTHECIDVGGGEG